MPITIPNTFTTATPVLASAVNANFTEVGTKALNRTGDNITGNITVDSAITIDGRDLSADLDQHVLTTSTPTFAGVTISGTGASALDVGGGINAGTGNVGIVDTTGKIPAISSTYFASLSGANLTAISESNITDGSLLARVASNETITGVWTYGALRYSIQRTTVVGGSSTNNFAINAGVSVILLDVSGSGSHSITGFTGGAEGRLIYIYNTDDADSVSLVSESASSTAANRIFDAFIVDPSLVGGQGTVMLYDGTSSRWRTMRT